MDVVKQPNISVVFDFEREFDVPGAKTWMQSHWHHSIYYSLAYVAAVHLAKHYMSSRPAFDLRTPMMVWSACLAVFSICGSVRLVPQLMYVLREHGVTTAVCNDSFYMYYPTAFWTYAFTISKLYELGDTAFIVLRKNKLSFLHWYHHTTVFIYCWHGYGLHSPTGLAFGGMNYVVHSFMYAYFTLKALRVRIPRPISVAITLMQILQMFIGVLITLTVYRHKAAGAPCAETDTVMYMAMVMYSSYMILFLNFFYQTYFRGGSSKKVAGKAAGVTNGFVSDHNQNGHSNGYHHVRQVDNGEVHSKTQ